MTKISVQLFCSLILFFILASANLARADIFLITDFDGTWSGDDYAEKGKEGSWSTYYRLFRVQESSHPMARVSADLPDEVLISHRDYEKVRQFLAQGEGLSGSIQTIPLRDAKLISGEKLEQFIPGYYQLINPVSYSRFRGMRRSQSGANHVNFLVEDYLNAVSMSKETPRKYSHRGIGESLIKHFLRDENLAKSVRVLTARGADDADWAELFAEMQKVEGYAFAPTTRLDQANERPKGVVALGHPEYANALGGSLKEKKIAYLKYLADRLLKKQPLELILGPDGENYSYYHTIIFQDNDPDILLAAHALFRELAEGRRYRIKFILRNSGTPEQVEQTKWFISKGTDPDKGGQAKLVALRDVVVMPNGRVRAPKDDELKIDPRVAKESLGQLLRLAKMTPDGRYIPETGRKAYKKVKAAGGPCEAGF
jgi:hypothetical protein